MKCKSNGSIEWYKARLVAKGYAQKYGLDYEETFSHLQEEVYMLQPNGYVHPNFSQYVCRLKKALYGPKQAPRAWNERINQYLQSVGFVVGKADHSLFVKKTNTDYVVIVIYVDDLILNRQ